ncbi:MAG: sulfatase-like hydrolase/transferase [Planctomycetes bacterium]|nr:sulfatase-like hydrolase/transferase [Planctomycetota bacterium]
MRRATPALVLLLLAACGASPGEVPGPRSLLLVTFDTTRADRIGCYGHPEAVTPTVDALAAHGVRFDACFSVAPVTFPSHVALMTGTLPPYNGVRDNGVHRAVPELLTLAEILHEEGFRTAAFTAAYVLDAQFGLDQGFELYEGVRHEVVSANGGVEERSAQEVNASATRWLDALDPKQPFFLWVHYFEPHQPYPATPPPGIRDGYDGEIHRADTALGQLLAHLDALGRRAETLVVMTSDHGESLGEHGEESHSFFAYQGTLHVPLVMSHASLPQDVTYADKVSLVDVYPTALALLGFAPPVKPPPSRSLAPLLAGEALPDVPTYFESLSPLLNYGWAPITGVAVGERKFIDVPRAELYDWRADPGELDNLLDAEPETATRLRAALQAVLRDNRPPEREHSAVRELSDADRVALASLGYTGTAASGDVVETLADPKDGIERIMKEERIRALVLAGRVEEGETLMTELLRDDPENAIFNAHYGFLKMSKREFGAAVAYLQKSLDLGFRSADNYANLGICRLFSGDAPGAKRELQAALDIDHKNLLALFWLANAHGELKEYAEAQARLEELLGLYHGGDDPTVEQARTLLQQLKAR